MGTRDFVVRRGDRVLHRERGNGIVSEGATWKRINELADHFHAPGIRVMVLNSDGAIIISVGVATLQAVRKAA